MSKVLVLYYSAFGYVAIVANAVAEGARSTGAKVDIKRVPGPSTAQDTHFHVKDSVPIVKIKDLTKYDAIILGSPTRFGRLSSPMASFLEQAGDLCSRGALNGKVGGAFTSPTNNHGGQETASMSILTNLLHFGMVIVGPPYSATTMADQDGERHPSVQDLEGAKQQGRLIAETAELLSGNTMSHPAPASAKTTSRLTRSRKR